jgi:hypothetical protein
MRSFSNGGDGRLPNEGGESTLDVEERGDETVELPLASLRCSIYAAAATAAAASCFAAVL